MEGGYVGEGSGYTIAPGWVLTAYHVLFRDADLNENQKITICWRAAPGKANVDPPSIKVKRNNIAWSDERLDLALIRCELPELGVEIPNAESAIARSIPSEEEIHWKSYGFLSELEDADGGRDTHGPSGTIGTINTQETTHSIQVKTGPLNTHELWTGFSGAPIFVKHKLSAIVLEANPGRRGASLRVVFIRNALDVVSGPDQKSLAELLGIDLSEDYVEALSKWFKPSFLYRIEQSDTVKNNATATFNALNPNANVLTLDQLADALLDCTPRQCVAFLERLVQSLGDHRSNTENAALHDVATLMMCLFFPDHNAVKTIQASRRRGERIIDSATVSRLDTEIAMASADQVAPSIDYPRGRTVFPYNVSSKEERCGIDERHRKAVEDIGSHLINKLVPGDCKGVVDNLWAEVYKKGAVGDLVASLKTADEKLKHMASRIGKKQRRFYVLLPPKTAVDKQASWALLKDWFDNLDLVKRSEFPDLETVSLISDLEEIILKTHSDKLDDEDD
ncbi:MAG: hypothetical protein DIZ78_12250 [endosymbiont of Escarpia spicata]|uniref:Serine protease n=1 Tax=endosymbiont of Escarpia spicata TaxID=2200908 RepID=A0A370DHD8_9GAMM|nr:MAG: hypothetical protein DIZ78_12250 [endosymbiont of Escarpia spicata]